MKQTNRQKNDKATASQNGSKGASASDELDTVPYVTVAIKHAVDRARNEFGDHRNITFAAVNTCVGMAEYLAQSIAEGDSALMVCHLAAKNLAQSSRGAGYWEAKDELGGQQS
jgi:hypothetical protein